MFHTSRLGRFLHVSYAVLATVVLGGALYTWRLRCEGFGCAGVGILWAAWAAFLFAPALVLGVYLAAKSGERNVLAASTRWVLGAQVLFGAALGIFWLVLHAR